MKNTIIGAIAGDVIGSVFEWNNIKSIDFSLFNEKSTFTDDTVLTIAVADAILNNKNITDTIWNYANKYSGRGYGGFFKKWIKEQHKQPYNSFGNGSAMRVSAVGFAYNTLEETLSYAKETANVTHNHPEGIKGAQAIATSIFLARTGKTKLEIKEYIEQTFNYNLDFTLDDIRPTYKFDVTCQGSVPQAIVAFLESTDYENAIRLAISIGGDSDTIACMTGGIASAFYMEIPDTIITQVLAKLPEEMFQIIEQFNETFGNY
jgi:ADP-ribosylglycohydrolase